jgi:hypothetical protein
LHADIAGVRQDLQIQTAELKSADAELRKLVKEVAVGEGADLHFQSIGFWWVVLSTFATSIPDEIANRLSHLF